MTGPERYDRSELAEVLAVDEQIDELRAGASPADDELLQMLGALRDDIDRDTAVILGRDDTVAWPFGPGLPPERHETATSSVGRRRRRLSRQLLAPPAAAVLVLGSTGVAAALSGSPTAPLNPLHRLIFGTAPTSDPQLKRDLADAGRLLEQASMHGGGQRANDLSQVSVLMSAARMLLPHASSAQARAEFILEINAAQARARALATIAPPAPASPTPSAAPLNPEPSTSAETENELAPPAPATVQSPAKEREAPDGVTRTPADRESPGTQSARPAEPAD